MKRKFVKKKDFWVYILLCKDGTFYTGYTPDLENRIKLHTLGKAAKYTRGRRPVKLIWSKNYKYFRKAFLEERRIKKLTRKQKEEFISSNK